MDELKEKPAVEQLTQRELEILRLIADGLSNKDIAGQLFIAPGTVKWYLKQIYSKLGVGSRTQAVAAARTLRVLGAHPVDPKTLLPQPSTPFVGRRNELAAIAER